MTGDLPDTYQRHADFLMPFGGVEPQVVLDAQHYAALRRASAKLETLHSGRGFVPAGPIHSLLVYNLARMAVVAVPFSAIAVLCAIAGAYPISLVFAVLAAIAILSIAPSVRASKPNSPKAAIQGFFGLIQAQRFSAAY